MSCCKSIVRLGKAPHRAVIMKNDEDITYLVCIERKMSKREHPQPFKALISKEFESDEQAENYAVERLKRLDRLYQAFGIQF
jgi:hypothetical protein